MAEGLLKHLAGDRFEAYSAGVEPTDEIHPCAIEADGCISTSNILESMRETTHSRFHPAGWFADTPESAL